MNKIQKKINIIKNLANPSHKEKMVTQFCKNIIKKLIYQIGNYIQILIHHFKKEGELLLKQNQNRFFLKYLKKWILYLLYQMKTMSLN